MKNGNRQMSGEWGLGRWLLLGIFGIALAVAIALAAGSLASQPIGLSGEPVSAGSALEPAQVMSPVPEVKRRKPDRRNESGSEETSNVGPVDPPVAPAPVTAPSQPAPPVETGTPDDSNTGSVPEAEPAEPEAGEGGGQDDD
ncbi:MAG: hypothetical protein ACSLFI_12320 [Solirubrobacterales bacterium]